MGLSEHIEGIQIVKAGLSLRERIEKWIAAQHHKVAIDRLRRFREQLEDEMEQDPWTDIEAPMVLFLHDVCNALGLSTDEQIIVLGQENVLALAGFLESRITLCCQALPCERQARALAHVKKNGVINLSVYRQLCPDWSDETLRLDLVDLVKQELLTKNGDKRGTYYTSAA